MSSPNRPGLADPMFGRGSLLVLNQILSALIGLVYWIVAARSYSLAEVGRQSVVLGVMMLISYGCQLGLKHTMNWYLPTVGDGAARFVTRAYLATIALALVIGSVVAATAGRWDGGLLEPMAMKALFVAGTAVWCVFNIQDGVLTGLRLTHLVPIENLAFNLTKLVVMVALAQAAPGSGILISWVVPLVPTVAVVNLIISSHLRSLLPSECSRPEGMSLMSVAGPDYVGGLANEAAARIPPVLIAAVVGSGAAAFYTQSWAVAAPIMLVASSLTASMTVEASADPQRRRDLLVLMRGVLVVVVGAMVVGQVVLAPYLLSLFGSQYAEGATGTLRLLALAALPGAIGLWGIAAARTTGQGRVILAIQAVVAATTLSAAAVLVDRWGAAGAAVGWLAGQTVAAMVAIVALRPFVRDQPAGGPIGRSHLDDSPAVVDLALAISGYRAGEGSAGAVMGRYLGYPAHQPRIWLTANTPKADLGHLASLAGLPKIPGVALSLAVTGLGWASRLPVLGRRVATVATGPASAGPDRLVVLSGGDRATNKLVGLTGWDRGRPTEVIRYARVAESRAELATEARSLAELDGRLGAPRLLAAGLGDPAMSGNEPGSPTWIRQEALAGELVQNRLSTDSFGHHADRVLAWCLAAADTSPATMWDRATDLGAEAVDMHSHDAQAQEVMRWAADQVAGLGELPAVTVHGDLAPWNLFVTDDGELRPFDWESADLIGPPLVDLHYYLVTAALLVESDLARPDAYHRLLDPDTDLGHHYQRVTAEYCATLGLDPTIDGPQHRSLRLVAWLQQAILERQCALVDERAGVNRVADRCLTILSAERSRSG